MTVTQKFEVTIEKKGQYHIDVIEAATGRMVIVGTANDRDDIAELLEMIADRVIKNEVK